LAVSASSLIFVACRAFMSDRHFIAASISLS
jgi:hypothetical protein